MAEINPVDPQRVRAFAHFFKRYMSISSVVAAALPIPITSLGLIPTFDVYTGVLSTYTPLFCFLLLGFIFFCRHHLAGFMFPKQVGAFAYLPGFIAIPIRVLVSLLPVILIGLSLYCIFKYHTLLEYSIFELRDFEEYSKLPFDEILKKAQPDQIKISGKLMVYFLGIFLAAESAFILMAIKEYLQDLIGLTDMNIITGN